MNHLACAALLVALFAASACSQNPPPAQPTMVGQPAPYGPLHNQQLGSADAKVQVVAVLPLKIDCHARNVEYLKRVGETCGAQVGVKFVDLKSKEAPEALKAMNMDFCATIAVNGKREFTRTTGAKLLLKGPPGVGYDTEDVCAVLQGELAKAYGDKALPLPSVPPGKSPSAK